METKTQRNPKREKQPQRQIKTDGQTDRQTDKKMKENAGETNVGGKKGTDTDTNNLKTGPKNGTFQMHWFYCYHVN